jgi:1-deoxy-D-xylulose-5-phosphate reductoisomerase
VNGVKHIAILGSTGSIGRSALEVIANFPDRFRVTYLTANRNIDLLQEQIRHFRPRGVAVLDETAACTLRGQVDAEVHSGEAGLLEIVAREDVDLVLSSLVGFAGLKPTLHAIEAGKDIALANKETLVVAGELVMRQAKKRGVQLLPVDSEHSAILQCLQGENIADVERLMLTASGGPFLNLDRDCFRTISVEQALNHPTWKMGNKITIDSATLMNKGLEVIEAFWLFGVPPEKIEVIVHPQSIIHSMVEFADGSIKAQLGVPDMKLPIQYALFYPDRPSAASRRLDLPALKQMTFQSPDWEKFKCLGLAYRAIETGGTMPAVMNAANEVAVQSFLDGGITFDMIPHIIEDAMAAHTAIHNMTLEDIIRVDTDTRSYCRLHTAAA